MQRYFTDETLTLNQSVTLDTATRKHAVQVLRMQAGAEVELADATGQAFVCTIAETDPLVVTVTRALDHHVELPVAVTLVCGVAKAQKAELVVQKATELGATRIVFANGKWGTAKWAANKVAKKLERLQLIARGAAEQSHRNLIPVVDFLPRLTDAATLKADAKLVAYEESAKAGEAAQLVQTLAANPQSLVVVFGPEGGIAPDELDQLTSAGFAPAGLGPRILRTETAPLYLLSAVSALTELRKDK